MQKKNHLVQSVAFNECKNQYRYNIFEINEKAFPKSKSVHNKNTLKVSYRSVGNMASIISFHNCSILNTDVRLEYGQNCRSRNQYPL